MPLKLTGGSLTLSVVVLAAAWTVRSLREQRRRRGSANPPADSSSKFFATLSLEAIALLAHLEAVPHYFIDVRTPEDAAAAPLAGWVAPAVHIPEPQVQTALKQPAVWRTYAAAAAAAAAALPDSYAPQATEGSTAVSPYSASFQQQQQQQQQQQPREVPPPSRHHLLVILADGEEQQRLAVSRAAAAGFDRVAVPSCGIEQLLDFHLPHSTLSREQQVMAAAAAAAVQCPAIHSDALAVLLGLVPLPEAVWQLFSQQGLLQPSPAQQQQQHAAGAGRSPGHTRSNSSNSLLAAAGEAAAAAEGTAAAVQQQRLLLLDVRRHDERTLYGAIPGAHHIPADELASALQLQPGPFRRRYHFEPPRPALDVLVLQSRASSRAQWAAQICLDAGCKHVFVYPDGVLGWHFGPGVDAYVAYQQGDKPPEPDARAVCEPDVALGVMELQQLGLMPLLMQQHGVATSR